MDDEAQADSVAQKFTGQERDSETGTDSFHASYYGGRWDGLPQLTSASGFIRGQVLQSVFKAAGGPFDLDPTKRRGRLAGRNNRR